MPVTHARHAFDSPNPQEPCRDRTRGSGSFLVSTPLSGTTIPVEVNCTAEQRGLRYGHWGSPQARNWTGTAANNTSPSAGHWCGRSKGARGRQEGNRGGTAETLD